MPQVEGGLAAIMDPRALESTRAVTKYVTSVGMQLS